MASILPSQFSWQHGVMPNPVIPAIDSLLTRTFQCVIVDNDMTLVDSNPGIISSWGTWITEYEIDHFLLADKAGMSTAAIVASLIPDESAWTQALTRIDELELEFAYQTTAFPGSERLLTELPDSRIVVASSGTHPIIRARIEAAGLALPTHIVSSEDVKRAKPSPDIFLYAAELLGFDPVDCLVIEDSINGLVAGRAAGCATLALTTSHPADELIADGLVNTLGDVQWLVTEHGVQVKLAQ